MKTKKRALRRHHYYRLKYNRSKYYRDDDASNRNQSINVNTVPRCSCALCGNPRKWHNQITRAEYLAQIDFIEQCSELYYNHRCQIIKYAQYY